MVMRKIMFNDRVVPMTHYVIDGLKTQTRRMIPEISVPKGARLELTVRKYKNRVKVYSDGDLYGSAWAGVFNEAINGMSDHHFYLVFDDNNSIMVKPRYKVGEVIGVAQSYSDLSLCDVFYHKCISENIDIDDLFKSPGCRNKLFVRPDLMVHKIVITGVRVEYLQDISDKDIVAEGFTYKDEFVQTFKRLYGAEVWEANPLVFVYDFERYDNAADIFK